MIDGVEAGYADYYLSGYVHKQKVFAASGLENTAHVVRIEWTGTKNAASSGTGIGIDALDVIGALFPTRSPPPARAARRGPGARPLPP